MRVTEKYEYFNNNFVCPTNSGGEGRLGRQHVLHTRRRRPRFRQARQQRDAERSAGKGQVLRGGPRTAKHPSRVFVQGTHHRRRPGSEAGRLGVPAQLVPGLQRGDLQESCPDRVEKESRVFLEASIAFFLFFWGRGNFVFSKLLALFSSTLFFVYVCICIFQANLQDGTAAVEVSGETALSKLRMFLTSCGTFGGRTSCICWIFFF